MRAELAAIRARDHAAVQRELLLPRAAAARCRARGGVARGARAVLRRARHRRRRRCPPAPARAPFNADAADVVAEFAPPVVSFHFGLPADRRCSRACGPGARRSSSSATTVDEARWLEARGVDAIIAQGLEAGGHRGMFLSDDLTTQLGTFALVPQIVARGEGAGDRRRRDRRRARRRGGDGAGRGRRAGRHRVPALPGGDDQRRAPRRARERRRAHTAVTNVFTGRPARGIVNRLMRELGPMSDAAPPFPLAAAAIAPLRAAGGGARAAATSRRCGRGSTPPAARPRRPRRSPARSPAASRRRRRFTAS